MVLCAPESHTHLEIQMETSLVRQATIVGAAACMFAGCGLGADDNPSTATAQSALALGTHLPGISDADFAEARDNFMLVENILDGVGPVFNDVACGRCHTLGAIGGAGEQIERRFGRVVNGVFTGQGANGGSLRQLFTVGRFTGEDGQSCNVPLEVEPATATVRNVGRLTTPLFG